MVINNFNYTYKITQVSIEVGTVEILYTPDSADLIPIRLNCNFKPKSYLDIRDEDNKLIYTSQDQVPFNLHIENTAKSCAPIREWYHQSLLLNNSNNLIGTTNNIEVPLSDYNVPITNPIPPTTD